ncbi:MAG: hypothetical protein QGF78_06980, partial [Candidatus Bathyarchaeota archaeon]|nr:hypothetical protein [Candidatus Bathyarchaeota archaeon]
MMILGFINLSLWRHPQLREKITQSKTSENLKLLVIDNSNLKFGLTLMSLGFFKKLFFADNIG